MKHYYYFMSGMVVITTKALTAVELASYEAALGELLFKEAA